MLHISNCETNCNLQLATPTIKLQRLQSTHYTAFRSIGFSTHTLQRRVFCLCIYKGFIRQCTYPLKLKRPKLTTLTLLTSRRVFQKYNIISEIPNCHRKTAL
ncbi:unnamed protein product [Allacma fusca]|uniref:Uncharacterized protein n=1 Tax=Allacma fusca TaxID=39272 RepID=A0A8J2P7C8_9HEXA|nr:unnamed protein product [Allacma fusca]